tara:strand:+ start:192 stop:470 length:279 start_codon:yes stop_codon:yes gene_type:complete
LKPFTPEKFNERFTFVSQKRIEHISLLCPRNTDFRVIVDVLVNDVVGKGNLLEGLGTGDDDFSCGKDAAGNLFHIFGGLELDFNRGVAVWFE